MNTQAAREGNSTLVALSAIAASTLIVEVCLTKFLSYKVFHHLTFAILSMVILSFGAAGILSYVKPKRFGLSTPDTFESAGFYAAAYAAVLCIVIPVFCFLPSTNRMLLGIPQLTSWAIPCFLALLSAPFFLAGICITQTLSCSRHSVATIYFVDLLAASLGVAACPMLLEQLGGYGTMALSSGLGLVAACAYWWRSWKEHTPWKVGTVLAAVLAISGCVAYPAWAASLFGTDIISPRDAATYFVLHFFGKFERTHWNAIARADVSRTGTANESSVYKFGLNDRWLETPILGRVILFDGGANTRQFKQVGPISQAKYLEDALWATPYAVRPDCRAALILGGGGGLDILVAKYRKIPQVDVVEMNPTMYKILLGKLDDPDGSYSSWLQSDGTTAVRVIHDEARHFATAAKPANYDVIHASGVDTLTAIQTGGMSLVENYLYTVDAVKDYARLLKPDGLLSLTHWRKTGPNTALRMFMTYLAYLDSVGVKDPWNHVAVIAGKEWTDSLMKLTPFTHEELQRLRDFAKQSNFTILFDPETRISHGDNFERVYSEMGFLSAQDRVKAIQAARDQSIPEPVTDDRPYFYSLKNSTDAFASKQSSSIPWTLLLGTFAVACALFVLPLQKARKEELGAAVYWSVLYFALTGFAF
jgi:spermidine synthase